LKVNIEAACRAMSKDATGKCWIGTEPSDIREYLVAYESHLDRVSTGSGSDLVKPWESKIVGNYILIRGFASV